MINNLIKSKEVEHYKNQVLRLEIDEIMKKRRKSKIRKWFKDNWGFVLILLDVLVLTIFTFLMVLR